MRAELKAVKAALEAAGTTTYIGWSDRVSPPYFVLTGPGWDAHELALSDDKDTLDAEFRVKAVGGNADAVYALLAKARGVLSPGFAEAPLTVTGRVARTKWVRSEFVDIDDSVTITDSNQHPAVGVDSYRVVSQPA